MRRIAALLLLSSPIALAQAPRPSAQPAPQLSPQAAYDQAITPVEITHRSIANWSDIETAALGTAVRQAKDACLTRTSATFTGDDLIALARLCALGQQWPTTFTAATTYINSADAFQPQLAQAYAYEVEADLNLNDERSALGASLAMLQSVPYGPLIDEVTTRTLRYLQLAFTSDALTLHSARQPFLLRLLRSPLPGSSPPVASPRPAVASIPRHTLFEHALDFAALELYANQPRLAEGILSDLDAATPPDLSPDDALPIADARRQYGLIGTHFPSLPEGVSLLSASTTQRIQPDFGSATVFLLFPPWCAQCLRQAGEIIPALSRLGDSNIHIYGLLADDTPPTPPPRAPVRAHPLAAPGSPHRPIAREATAPASAPTQREHPKSQVVQLRGTPTVVVAPSTLASFAATDFPFLIATDHDGIIRLLLPAAPENALVSGGAIDQLTSHLIAEWPPADPH
jgi:hypothetical protein